MLTHTVLARPAIDRDHSPALAILVAKVDEQSLAVVFDADTVVRVADFVQGLGPVAICYESRPSPSQDVPQPQVALDPT